MKRSGADTQNRTGDLILTKDALYRLSYISIFCLERAAGIEPASSAWKAEVIAIIRCPRPTRSYCSLAKMVEGEGFEPSKAVPADLQSDPFGHSGTPPHKTGAAYPSRTDDLLITSQLLYQLS